MLTRCHNPRCKPYPYYPYYGGRGIGVCSQWTGEESFENFLAAMGERPKGTTLDRYPNNNGNYEPNNCRWATPSEQVRNTRKSRLTMDLVQEIHVRHEHGEKVTSIGRRMKVDYRQISAILHQKAWKEAIDGYPSMHIKTLNERTSP